MHWKKRATRVPRQGKKRSSNGYGLLFGLLVSCQSVLALPLDKLKLPPGFRVTVFASEVENARQLAVAEDGTVFAGSRKAGNVYALPDRNRDGRADRVQLLAQGLQVPSGIFYHQGSLYVAALNRILRYDNVQESVAAQQQTGNAPTPSVLFDDFPDDAHHGWKYLDMDSQGRLVVPVGVPCNVCNAEPPYGTIVALDLNEKKYEILAQGVRNSVGFDFHPQTGELWFTDNGRDWLGDDLPPEELNRVQKTGEHFGFPFFHAGTIADPEYGSSRYRGKLVSATDFSPPAHTFPAHHAPLGMTFYTGSAFPEQYHGAIFVAEHGSWNRSERAGYRVSAVFLDEKGKVSGSEAFITGWLQPSLLGGDYWGRPADVLMLPDGSLLIADDSADCIYRVTYRR